MTNYFSLLSLDTNFTLDEVALQRNYIRAQQQSHPDRLVGKPDNERAVAIQHAMDVNDAYEALKDPLKRAQHLLELRGIFVNSEDDTLQPSAALLMEVMEMREQLMGAQDERDAALIVRDVKAAMDVCVETLGEVFANADRAGEGEARVALDQEAAQLTMKLRYLGKSLEEAYGKQYSLSQIQ